VMPHLRNEWPEFEDDSRWWCHPYDGRVRPEETLGVHPPVEAPSKVTV
jgi:hypothetical protein